MSYSVLIVAPSCSYISSAFFTTPGLNVVSFDPEYKKTGYPLILANGSIYPFESKDLAFVRSELTLIIVGTYIQSVIAVCIVPNEQ